MDFYTMVTCAWLACTPMFDHQTHMTKAECEAVAADLKGTSCVPENDMRIVKQRAR